MAKLTEPLTLTRVGEHWIDGGLYQDAKGRYYVDHFNAVESGQVNSVCILCPSNEPDGEPDYTLTGIIILTNPPTERERRIKEYEHTLMMLGRMEFDCYGFFSEGDCRHLRPDCLWAGNVKGEVLKMRELYQQLPDDIKDASPMTKQEIDDYARRLEEWAQEEFSKPEYDPVPTTKRKDLPQEIELSEKLYYKDDDGNYQTPTHVWFSCDFRRWHQDERAVHGRAMTSYLGKHGTTLAPVLISSLHQLGMVPYRRDDLCNVSCHYEYKPLHGRLYGFYYE